MHYRHMILFTLLVLYIPFVKAQSNVFRVHADYPYIGKEDKLFLDIFYSSDTSFQGSYSFKLYKYETTADSICILSKRVKKFFFKKGLYQIKADFSKKDSLILYYNKFYGALIRTNSLSPGFYKIFITVYNDKNVYETIYTHTIDTSLPASSKIRHDINKRISPKYKAFLSAHTHQNAKGKRSQSSGDILSSRKSKIDKVARKNELITKYSVNKEKSRVDLFYSDWFVGRYEVNNTKQLSSQIKNQDESSNSDDKDISTDMDRPSIASQYKKKNTEKKDQTETKGEIGLNTNLGKSQDPSSGVDNNYYELRGRIETPICNIPVELEGLYTSQDNHREIKSSYFKAHYDVEKMKEQLNSSMSSYNKKIAETKSKGLGMTQMYKSGISNLEGQKARLQNGGNDKSVKSDKGNIGDHKSSGEDLKKAIAQKKDSINVDNDDSDDDEASDTTSIPDSAKIIKKSDKKGKAEG
ncbi:MAG: hypothetical protein JWQ38_2551 [Flavipsychrobacter sp.]|nr:hypothetical protein [Flavipsychrobacter sp.]